MEPLLLVDDVYKLYEGAQGGVPALCGVSFSLAAGAFAAVRGPSGCGKSTLLHLAGAMDRPTRGSVRLKGRLLNDLSLTELARLRRRQVGFVFQAFNLLPTLTVRENVMLPLLLDGQREKAAQQRADALLEHVDLTGRAAHLPSQLSGGEMQRVAVARAVAAQPDLLLADEPTGSLDSANGRRVMQLLADLNRRLGITVLLATHSPQAAAFARQTLYLHDGRLQRIELHAELPQSL